MADVWWQKYVGIPFVDNGRGMNGVDCAGLVWLIVKQECGVDMPCFDGGRYSVLNIDELARLLRAGVDRFYQPVRRPPRALDMAVFGRKFYDYHVGIFVDPWRIIHSKEGEHVKVVSLRDIPFFADYRGPYELKR